MNFSHSHKRAVTPISCRFYVVALTTFVIATKTGCAGAPVVRWTILARLADIHFSIMRNVELPNTIHKSFSSNTHAIDFMSHKCQET